MNIDELVKSHQLDDSLAACPGLAELSQARELSQEMIYLLNIDM
jgi:hypothetical protein